MKSNITLCILLVTFLVACENKELASNSRGGIFNLEDFPQKRVLSGEKISTGALLTPRRILLLKDYLVVAEHHVDTLLSIFDRNSMKLQRKLGVAGVGPNELEMPWRLYGAKEDNKFWVKEIQTKKMSLFDASIDSVIPESYINFRNDLIATQETVFLDDTTLLATHVYDSAIFIKYNLDGDRLAQFGKWNDLVERKAPPHVISDLFQSVLKTDPGKRYFVLASLTVDMIQVFDSFTDTVMRISGPYNHMPDWNIGTASGYPRLDVAYEENVYMYTDVVLTEERIYTLFSGLNFEDVNHKKDQYNNHILVFDYNGNPLVHYELDTSIYGSFEVDEESGTFYGLTFDEEPDIVVFKF